MSKIWLLFDDGPEVSSNKNIKTIENISKLCTKNNVCGIFALNGKNLYKYSDIIKSIKNNGHIIINHSENHENMHKNNINICIDSFEKTREKLKDILNEDSKIIQFPFLSLDPRCCMSLLNKNFKIIDYKKYHAFHDYKHNLSQNSMDKYKKKIDTLNLKNKTILGLHNTKPTELQLDYMVKKLKEKGYKFHEPYSNFEKDENIFLTKSKVYWYYFIFYIISFLPLVLFIIFLIVIYKVFFKK